MIDIVLALHSQPPTQELKSNECGAPMLLTHTSHVDWALEDLASIDSFYGYQKLSPELHDRPTGFLPLPKSLLSDLQW